MGFLDTVRAQQKQLVWRYAEPVYKATYDNLPAWLQATGESSRFDMLNTSESQPRLYTKLSWIQTAINNVAITAITSALKVKNKRSVDGQENDVDNHPFEQLLQRPNPAMSRSEFMEATISYRALTGNAYWWLNRKSEKAPPDELWIVPPDKLRPVPDGKLFIKGYLYNPGDGKEIPLETWEIVHFKRFNPANVFLGLSAIDALQLVAMGDLAAQEWNTNYFAKDNAKLPGALAFADSIDDDAWQRMRADIEHSYGGTKRKLMMLRNAGKGGVQWLNMAVSQREMEFLAGRQFNKEEIFSALAPGLVSILDKNATEANAKAGKNTFVELGVWPHLVHIAEKITNDVLPTYGENLVAEFEDIRVIDRAMKLQEQSAFAQVHTIDEIRQEFYQDDPIGDSRGQMLVAELQHASVVNNASAQRVAGSQPAIPADAVPPAISVAKPAALLEDNSAKQPEANPAKSQAIIDIERSSESIESVIDDEDIASEIKRFKRWLKKRANPDVSKFASDILTDERKAAIVESMTVTSTTKEDGADQPFFTLTDGRITRDAYKAMLLQLDPDDEEKEQKMRMAIEQRSERNVKKAFADMMDTLFPYGSNESDPNEVAARLQREWKASKALEEALRKALLDGADLGVNYAIHQLDNVGFSMDWTLAAKEASDWASGYAFNLISGINSTSQQHTQQALQKWINSGDDFQTLIDDMSKVFGASRASIIASTETTRAYAQGALISYQKSGVVDEWEWQTANDEIVRECEICYPLQGKRAPLGKPFEGGYIFPGHIGCRCWANPVLSDRYRNG